MRTFTEIQQALNGPHGDNATLYARTVALISAAKFPDRTDFVREMMKHFILKCHDLNIALPHDAIAEKMWAIGADYYAGERFNDLPPNPALYDYHGDSAPVGQLRDILLRQQRKAIEPAATLDAFSNAFVASNIALTRHLPQSAQHVPNTDSHSPTIPLIDLLTNVDTIIEEMLEPFSSPETMAFGLFRFLHLAREANLEKIKETKRPALRPSPSEIVKGHLQDTYLDELLLQTQVPFVIPDETRFSGHWIIAPSGRGKTTLLHTMFLEDLEKDASIIVMDSKGDLINPIKSMAVIADRLILIEPDSR